MSAPTLTMGKATRDAFGEALRELGRERAEIVVVDGDVSNSTRTEWFGKEFPDRFFNVRHRRVEHGRRGRRSGRQRQSPVLRLASPPS